MERTSGHLGTGHLSLKTFLSFLIKTAYAAHSNSTFYIITDKKSCLAY